MNTRPLDTSPDALEAQRAAFADLGPDARFRAALEMSEAKTQTRHRFRFAVEKGRMSPAPVRFALGRQKDQRSADGDRQREAPDPITAAFLSCPVKR